MAERLDDSFLLQDEPAQVDRLDDSFLLEDEAPASERDYGLGDFAQDALTETSSTAKKADPQLSEDDLRLRDFTEEDDPFESAYADVEARTGISRESISGEEYVAKKIRPSHLKPTGKTEEKGAIEAFSELGQQPERLVPFLGQSVDLTRLNELYDAAKRVEAGKPEGDDEKLLKNWMDRAKEDAERGSGLGYKVVSILGQLPAFVGEFATTGGIYTAGKELTAKGITKALKKTVEESIEKGLLRKGLEAAGGAALQTIPVMAARIPTGAMDRMLGQYDFSNDEKGQLKAVMAEGQDDFNDAMVKSVGDAYIEMLSERSGGMLPELWKKIPMSNKVGALKSALFSRWQKRFPNKKVSDFLTTIREKGGWHGVIGEMFEERVGEAARYATGVEEHYAPVEAMKRGELGENLLSEAIAFSIPGASASILRAATSARYDQHDQPPELFSATHTSAAGQPLQMVTQKGEVIPDTYMAADGTIVRETGVQEVSPGSGDPSMNISAVAASIKSEVFGEEAAPKPGIISGVMPQPEVEVAKPVAPAAAPDSGTWEVKGKTYERGPDGKAREVKFVVPAEAAVPEPVAEEAPEPARRMEKKQVEPAKKFAPKTEVDAAAVEAATSPTNELPDPTEAQKEAGNYKKGHTTVQGLDIAIENPAGSKRRPEWPTLKQHYGYIKRTVGADSAPGAAPHEVEQVDVFVKPGKDISEENPVFIIDQYDEAGKVFDEHKIMMGFATEQEASEAYLANYTKGWKGLKQITQATPEEFKTWLSKGDSAKEYSSEISSTETVKPIESKDKLDSEGDVNRETLQLRSAREIAWAKELPGLSRRIYEEISTAALGIDPRTATEIELQSLRQRLQEPGVTPAEAVRAVWGDKLADAPRRLQPTTKSDVAMQAAPSSATRGRVEKTTKPGDKKALEQAKPKEIAARQELFIVFQGQKQPVASFEEAGDKFSQVVDEAAKQGFGSRDLGENPIIVDQTGKQVAYISYNGRVWEGTYSKDEKQKEIKIGDRLTAEERFGSPEPAPSKKAPKPEAKVAKLKPAKPKPPPDLAARPAPEPYKAMEGREISYQVQVESTGEEFTVTVDAAQVMREIDARAESLKELRRCL